MAPRNSFNLRIVTVVVLMTAAHGFSPCTARADSQLTTEQWLEDLAFVVSSLKSHHPNLYYRISEEAFEDLAAESREEIMQARSDVECYLAIEKTIAGIQDGHTQLVGQGVFDLTDLRFPFRLDRFTDGIFITVIDRACEQYLGSRVVAINGRPIEEILAMRERLVNIDNRFGRIRPALTGILAARIMYGMGILDSVEKMELDLITRDGEPAKLTLDSRKDNSPINWVNRLTVGPAEGDYVHPGTVLGERTPLHLKKLGDNIEFYWFEHLVGEKAIYFQFNQVGNKQDHDESFAEFTERLWSYIDEHADEVEKLIIDVRYNDGGNGRMVMPFVNHIIKRDHINNRNSLFVLIGKRTYSAAVIFMTELEVHTEAVFIGDPPACPFNFFSDQVVVGNLPNSGFGLGIASRQIDNAWCVHRVYFPPDIPAPFSSRDYFAGNDPALEMALHGDKRTIEDIAVEEGAQVAYTCLEQQKEKYADLDWWIGFQTEQLEGGLNNKGYQLMQAHDLEDAYEVFTLNTMLFPNSSNVWDSLGECCFNMKKYDLSLQHYRKSVEIDPTNENGSRMMDRILEEMKLR